MNQDQRPTDEPTTADMAWADTAQLVRVNFSTLTEVQVVERVFDSLDEGTGGHLITPNIDVLRRLRQPGLRGVLDSASIVVADGAPILWASHLRGLGIPERVTGADLIWSLTAEAARRSRSVYILGGLPGVADQAKTRLEKANPSLRVVGTMSPPMGFEHDEDALRHISEVLTDARPDIVLVGLGFPKQDVLAARLRGELPETWFIGCGAAIDFAAGNVKRAPRWIQRVGCEWLFRLAQEPRRLGRRYLVDDLPFAFGLMSSSLGVFLHRKIIARA